MNHFYCFTFLSRTTNNKNVNTYTPHRLTHWPFVCLCMFFLPTDRLVCVSFNRERGIRGVDHYGHSLNEPIEGIVDYNSWRKIARYLQFSLSVFYRMFAFSIYPSCCLNPLGPSIPKKFLAFCLWILIKVFSFQLKHAFEWVCCFFPFPAFFGVLWFHFLDGNFWFLRRSKNPFYADNITLNHLFFPLIDLLTLKIWCVWFCSNSYFLDKHQNWKIPLVTDF